MMKTQVLIWLGCLLSGAAIYLDEFTHFPKYLVYPLWLPALISFWSGIRAAHRSPLAQKPLGLGSRNKRFGLIVAAALLGGVGSLYLNTGSNLGLPFGTRLIIALVTIGLVVAILYWRIYRRPIEGEPRPVSKRWLILGAIAFICFVLAEGVAILDRDSEATRNVNREISVALQKWRTSPAGIQRGEELVRLLRAIDSSHAPPDVQRALGEYADALDHGVTVLKASVGSTEVDQEIADKKTALDRAIQKHL